MGPGRRRVLSRRRVAVGARPRRHDRRLGGPRRALPPSAYGRPVVHIPNGVDLRPSRPRRDEITTRWDLGEGAYVLFVGRLVPEKAPDLLLAAFRPLAGAAPAGARRAGPASPTTTSSGCVELAAADPSVVLMPGYVYGETLRELYANAAAFVLPVARWRGSRSPCSRRPSSARRWSRATSRRTSRCSARTRRGAACSRRVTRRPWPVPWPGCWATGRASGPAPWRSVTASSAPTAGRTRPTPPNVSTAGSWTHVGRDLSTADGNRRRVVSIRKCNYSTLRRLGFRRRKGPC